MTEYQNTFNMYKEKIESGIDFYLEQFKIDIPEILFESMKYSACNGGKRIRGVLLLSVSDILGIDMSLALKYAVAVEMIHASSLIHDDLPCMDNDTMRRGKPCNHIVYGEANALYAGLGLLNLAYEILIDEIQSEGEMEAIKLLMESAGPRGIMKGQSLDIYYEGKEMDYNILREIHSSKTGALIKASVVIPGLLAKAEKPIIDGLTIYGEKIGTAFQIVDDVLDVTATSDDLGKTAGKDVEADKLTYVKLFGVEGATKMAKDLIDTAVDQLNVFGNKGGFLIETANMILNRRN